MNHWLKCNLVTQLNFPSKTFFLIIILNFQWQKLLRIQSFNSTYILALKISKWPSWNPTHWELSNYAKSAPKFPNNFYL
jgi:hypothetical protein